LLTLSVAQAAVAAPQCPAWWEASAGVLPEGSVPTWTAVDTAPTPPVLQPGSLRLETSSDQENQYYILNGVQLAIPAKWTIETSVWFVSGSSSSVTRAPIAIGFEVPGPLANTLFIDDGELFLYAGSQCSTKGNSVSVPTSDGFHTYRIEIDTLSGSIDVFQDGGHSGLTGTLIPVSGGCGGGPRVYWGEASSLTHGVSEWAYLMHDAGTGAAWIPYCTSGTSASGCQPTLSASGLASASAGSGFSLHASGAEGAKDGLFFTGTNGRQANPWGNGSSVQCVVPPVKRTGVLPAVGQAGVCDGSFDQDLAAVWAAKPSKNPGAGVLVQAQLWYRDPLNTSNQTTSLSNAIEFAVCP